MGDIMTAIVNKLIHLIAVLSGVTSMYIFSYLAWLIFVDLHEYFTRRKNRTTPKIVTKPITTSNTIPTPKSDPSTVPSTIPSTGTITNASTSNGTSADNNSTITSATHNPEKGTSTMSNANTSHYKDTSTSPNNGTSTETSASSNNDADTSSSSETSTSHNTMTVTSASNDTCTDSRNDTSTVLSAQTSPSNDVTTSTRASTDQDVFRNTCAGTSTATSYNNNPQIVLNAYTIHKNDTVTVTLTITSTNSSNGGSTLAFANTSHNTDTISSNGVNALTSLSTETYTITITSTSNSAHTNYKNGTGANISHGPEADALSGNITSTLTSADTSTCLRTSNSTGTTTDKSSSERAATTRVDTSSYISTCPNSDTSTYNDTCTSMDNYTLTMTSADYSSEYETIYDYAASNTTGSIISPETSTLASTTTSPITDAGTSANNDTSTLASADLSTAHSTETPQYDATYTIARTSTANNASTSANTSSDEDTFTNNGTSSSVGTSTNTISKIITSYSCRTPHVNATGRLMRTRTFNRNLNFNSKRPYSTNHSTKNKNKSIRRFNNSARYQKHTDKNGNGNFTRTKTESLSSLYVSLSSYMSSISGIGLSIITLLSKFMSISSIDDLFLRCINSRNFQLQMRTNNIEAIKGDPFLSKITIDFKLACIYHAINFRSFDKLFVPICVFITLFILVHNPVTFNSNFSFYTSFNTFVGDIKSFDGVFYIDYVWFYWKLIKHILILILSLSSICICVLHFREHYFNKYVNDSLEIIWVKKGYILFSQILFFVSLFLIVLRLSYIFGDYLNDYMELSGLVHSLLSLLVNECYITSLMHNVVGLFFTFYLFMVSNPMLFLFSPKLPNKIFLFDYYFAFCLGTIFLFVWWPYFPSSFSYQYDNSLIDPFIDVYHTSVFSLSVILYLSLLFSVFIFGLWRVSVFLLSMGLIYFCCTVIISCASFNFDYLFDKITSSPYYVSQILFLLFDIDFTPFWIFALCIILYLIYVYVWLIRTLLPFFRASLDVLHFLHDYPIHTLAILIDNHLNNDKIALLVQGRDIHGLKIKNLFRYALAYYILFCLKYLFFFKWESTTSGVLLFLISFSFFLCINTLLSCALFSLLSVLFNF